MTTTKERPTFSENHNVNPKPPFTVPAEVVKVESIIPTVCPEVLAAISDFTEIVVEPFTVKSPVGAVKVTIPLFDNIIESKKN